MDLCFGAWNVKDDTPGDKTKARKFVSGFLNELAQ